MSAPAPDDESARLLDDVRAFLARFVAFPSEHELAAVTLWAAHAHALDAFESTPRLALLSPEPGSGKTRVLELLDLLVPEPLHALSASPAAIFRTLDEGNATLLLDEADAIFGRRGKDDGAEDLRALLNAGHRRGATIPRCVGPRHEVARFPVYAAVALAGLGDLPDTLMSRSVIVRMRKRAPAEKVEPFRYRLAEPTGSALRERLRVFAEERRAAIERWPTLPDGVVDRAADVWEPLLAVADAAGGHWPETARAAAVESCKVVESRAASLGVRLLADVRSVFADRDRMATEEILRALCEMDEAPWADLHGRPLNARGLSRRLGQYGITSTKVKIAGASVRGYQREPLYDAWTRYLPPPDEDGTSGTRGTEPLREPQRVPFKIEVPEPGEEAEPPAPNRICGVPEVPEVPDLRTPECTMCGATGVRLVPHHADDRLLCPGCCVSLFPSSP